MEGSEELAEYIPGNGSLDTFRSLTAAEQTGIRKQAIWAIRDLCCGSGIIGLVTGHFSFMPPEADGGAGQSMRPNLDELARQSMQSHRDEETDDASGEATAGGPKNRPDGAADIEMPDDAPTGVSGHQGSHALDNLFEKDTGIVWSEGGAAATKNDMHDPPPPPPDRTPTIVWTEADSDTYTHIIYLATDPADIVRNVANDGTRFRQYETVETIRRWQAYEIKCLREMLADTDTRLLVVTPDMGNAKQVVGDYLASLPSKASVASNNAAVEKTLDNMLRCHDKAASLAKALVFDADRTLAPQDSHALYAASVGEYRAAAESESARNDHADEVSPKTIFGGPLGYSLDAFQAVVALCYRGRDSGVAPGLCRRASGSIQLYSRLRYLLREAENHPSVVCVVATCGVADIWRHALARAGLSRVLVLGNSLKNEGYVMTPEAKAAIVARFRRHHGLHVTAFGDSPIDIPMLWAANQAVVVFEPDLAARSTTMPARLAAAIEEGLSVHQLSIARCDERIVAGVPLLSLGPKFWADDRSTRKVASRAVAFPPGHARCLHATDRPAAQLLATPTRDASLSGHRLREAHARVGFYLATEFVAKILGTESYTIEHVQGHDTDGHRLADEKETLIMAMMRGGEPMALGVSEAFPQAALYHIHDVDGFGSFRKEPPLEGKKAIILVDSVINSGNSVAKFVSSHLRGAVASGVRIVVVTGVMQSKVLSLPRSEGRVPVYWGKNHGPVVTLREQLIEDPNLWIVALRLSSNQYTGVWRTDTGNRLFNTTNVM
jgi:uracil phosphoribosyltransferase/phosphoserine phosphatase